MGGASFATTFLVPLVSKYLPLNKIMFYTQASKDVFISIFDSFAVFFWYQTTIAFYLSGGNFDLTFGRI